MMLANASQSVSAQSAQDDGVSKQLWSDYNPRWVLPSGVELFGDIGYRTELGAQDWRRLVVRPSVQGPVASFQLSGGVGGFFTNNKIAANRIEIRPFQGIAATWPSRRILGLEHYFRVEERFEFVSGTDRTNLSVRLRYQLQTQYALPGPQEGPIWRLRAMGEAFLTVAGDQGQFRENVRLGLGVGREFGSAWSAWLDFVWQKTGRVFSGAPTDDLFIRVRVHQDWIR